MTGLRKPDLQFEHFNTIAQNGKSLNNDEINVLFEHNDGSLWIGTQGGGINILNQPSNGVSYLGVEHGLPGEDVFSLLPDGNGNLWISTNKGLSCC